MAPGAGFANSSTFSVDVTFVCEKLDPMLYFLLVGFQGPAKGSERARMRNGIGVV